MTTPRERPSREAIDRDYWPCACVKRDKAGNMSHIKLHHKSRAKCRVCGATRADAMMFQNSRTPNPENPQ